MRGLKVTAADLAAPAPAAAAVEREVAFDMLKRGVWLAPVVLIAASAIWGSDGAASAGVAIALVAVNLVLAAVALSWAASRSLTMLMAVALGGFAVRMGLVTVVLLAVKDEPWIDLTALGVSVLVTHLGLLFWELRYVSASLAFPALKPGHPAKPGTPRPSEARPWPERPGAEGAKSGEQRQGSPQASDSVRATSKEAVQP